jgi:hypothetical protein
MNFKSGEPTLDGGKSSFSEEETSSTLRAKRFLIFLEEKTKKDKKLLSGRDTTELTRDGQLPIPTKLERRLLKDTIRDMDSISPEYSTLDQDFHSKELLNVSVATTLSSEDMSREELHSNSSSILEARLSSPNNGNTYLWTFPETDLPTTSE